MFVVRRPALGVAFLLPPLIALLYILHHYTQKTKIILERILLGEIPADPWLMYNLIKHESHGDTAWWLSVALWVYLVSWLLGIIASALAGHWEDKRLAAVKIAYDQSLQAERNR